MVDGSDYWVELAAKILKSEMRLRHLTYDDLNVKLKEIGIEDTRDNVARKISRGTFSFFYFLQCLKAMGVEKLDVKFYFGLKDN